MKYILSVDQSTSSTKALLFDENQILCDRVDISHKQIINDLGYVEHDPMEIYQNVIYVMDSIVKKNKISPSDIYSIGISNQRETALSWDKITKKPLYNAIVWQCERSKNICKRLEKHNDKIREITGLPISTYFSASKFAWLKENVEDVKTAEKNGTLCFGNIDSWLLFMLTSENVYKTDYSNASRTQLFDINTLSWSLEVADLFKINTNCLPEVCSSNAYFGTTNLNGLWEADVPILAVMGDSHGALFGQGCITTGMLKTTYGTGSSVMLNTGDKKYVSKNGLVTSIAWGIDNKVSYVLEGNINYSGAVLKWLINDLEMFSSEKQIEELSKNANKNDETYIVPAFTGLQAPHWKPEAKALIYGMNRNTSKAEIAKSALECMAYQVCDIISAMNEDILPNKITKVFTDGGPTKNGILMQFQADILDIEVFASHIEELSGAGVAYLAGITASLYSYDIFNKNNMHKKYSQNMIKHDRDKKYNGWQDVINKFC